MTRERVPLELFLDQRGKTVETLTPAQAAMLIEGIDDAHRKKVIPPWSIERCPGSRARNFAHARFYDHAELVGYLHNAPYHVAFGEHPRRRHSRFRPLRGSVAGLCFSYRRFTNDLGASAHGSEPMWIATPSLKWTFTILFLAGFSDARRPDRQPPSAAVRIVLHQDMEADRLEGAQSGSRQSRP